MKWHLPLSTAAEHRGRTEKCPIKDHKVSYDFEAKLPVKLVVDKNGMLQESFIDFEVVQEYSGGGKPERITLGHVKLNLAEYVEQSEMNRMAEGDEPGVTRRYLMQDSKINSTLKISVFMRQIEGDRNFVAPALKTAQVFSGIAGIVSGEQGDAEDVGSTCSTHGNVIYQCLLFHSNTNPQCWVSRSGRASRHVQTNTGGLLVCSARRT